MIGNDSDSVADLETGRPFNMKLADFLGKSCDDELGMSHNVAVADNG